MNDTIKTPAQAGRNRLIRIMAGSAGALLLLILGAVAGYDFALKHAATRVDTQVKTQVKTEPRILYWFDPMQPTQHFDKPGKSPFRDMLLVPLYAGEAMTSAGAVASSGDMGSAAMPGILIDSGTRQRLGVRLTNVVRGSMNSSIEVLATVQLNERLVSIVQARSPGFVEKVMDHAPGDVIHRGAGLVQLLLPEWASAQTEYLSLRRLGDPALIQAARGRLHLLGMSEQVIATVESEGKASALVTMEAPRSGVIQTLDLRAGMTVNAGTTIASINGLETVWLEAALPETQAALARVGGKMEAFFTAWPGEAFHGKIMAVLPVANADSRTLRVRMQLDNRDGRLKPGMFAHGTLEANSGKPELIVPTDAVIRTGRRDVVLLAGKEGRFAPVEVILGQESNGKVAILSGLKEGDSIVESGQFLIDSEASLKGMLARRTGSPK